jgi:hypothetical protein
MDNMEEENNLEEEEYLADYYFSENECHITTDCLDGVVTKNPFDDIELMDLLGTKYTKLIYDLSCFPIDRLPNGITHLNITHQCFNYPIDNLPSNLIYLRIRGTKLIFGESGFNQPLNFLPSGLKILILEALENYTHPLDNLPPNLETLYILNRQQYELPLNNLPSSITRFYNYDMYNPDIYCDDTYTEYIDEIDKLWHLT